MLSLCVCVCVLLRRRREEEEEKPGIQNQKQEPPHKDVGKKCFQWPISFPCCPYAFRFSRSKMRKSYLTCFQWPSFSVAAPMSHLDFLGQNPKKISHVSSRAHRFPLCAHVPLTCFGPKPTFLLNNKAKDNVVFLIPGVHTTRYSPNTCVI